jgi:hypothetical protein
VSGPWLQSLLDQIDAARSSTGDLVDGMAALTPDAETASRVEAEWADRIIRARQRAYLAGDPSLTVCEHAKSPTTLIMPTWCNAVVCPDCIATIVPLPTVEQDGTCDACGQYVGEVRSIVLATGFVVLLGGVCARCHGEEQP